MAVFPIGVAKNRSIASRPIMAVVSCMMLLIADACSCMNNRTA